VNSIEVGTIAEIEITPEMVAAGVSALLNFDSRFENEAECVVEIFRTMTMAKAEARLAAENLHISPGL
jgi:hypothetical protein